MLGERGGHTRTFSEGEALVEAHKPDWVALINQAIDCALAVAGEFHADDLVPLGIPAEHKNLKGVCVNAKIRAGFMVEVGRRRASAPESHGRKSGVYRVTDLGRSRLSGVDGTTNPIDLCTSRRSTGAVNSGQPEAEVVAAGAGEAAEALDVVEPVQLSLVPDAELYRDAA